MADIYIEEADEQNYNTIACIHRMKDVCRQADREETVEAMKRLFRIIKDNLDRQTHTTGVIDVKLKSAGRELRLLYRQGGPSAAGVPGPSTGRDSPSSRRRKRRRSNSDSSGDGERSPKRTSRGASLFGDSPERLEIVEVDAAEPAAAVADLREETASDRIRRLLEEADQRRREPEDAWSTEAVPEEQAGDEAEQLQLRIDRTFDEANQRRIDQGETWSTDAVLGDGEEEQVAAPARLPVVRPPAVNPPSPPESECGLSLRRPGVPPRMLTEAEEVEQRKRQWKRLFARQRREREEREARRRREEEERQRREAEGISSDEEEAVPEPVVRRRRESLAPSPYETAFSPLSIAQGWRDTQQLRVQPFPAVNRVPTELRRLGLDFLPLVPEDRIPGRRRVSARVQHNTRYDAVMGRETARAYRRHLEENERRERHGLPKINFHWKWNSVDYQCTLGVHPADMAFLPLLGARSKAETLLPAKRIQGTFGDIGDVCYSIAELSSSCKTVEQAKLQTLHTCRANRKLCSLCKYLQFNSSLKNTVLSRHSCPELRFPD
ncbi:hypothetical protein JTE90_017549 [Oedothorax gibbosus]|uniref:Uncharacterized protein n=1 Tax=Oedothorax gibbosus TaxID=931172 RepID=A0AAV6UPJ2_9ARAC|nr:hypothetical protein JTE90_017549 [Oedothorax gibbosus]